MYWEMADLLALLCGRFSCVFVCFKYGFLDQVWYLIVLIPDLCLPLYSFNQVYAYICCYWPYCWLVLRLKPF